MNTTTTSFQFIGFPSEWGALAKRGNLKEGGSSTAVFCELWLSDWYDKGTSLEFAVCNERTLFCPHPKPLSHSMGEGCRGARRCALMRLPPRPPAGEQGILLAVCPTPTTRNLRRL